MRFWFGCFFMLVMMDDRAWVFLMMWFWVICEMENIGIDLVYEPNMQKYRTSCGHSWPTMANKNEVKSSDWTRIRLQFLSSFTPPTSPRTLMPNKSRDHVSHTHVKSLSLSRLALKRSKKMQKASHEMLKIKSQKHVDSLSLSFFLSLAASLLIWFFFWWNNKINTECVCGVKM
jgi:hypothetical protein